MTYTRPAKPKHATRSMIPVTDYELVNRARVREEMDPLPSSDELNATLQQAGFVACFDKPYPWAEEM